MPRVSKPASLRTDRKISKEEIQTREEIEEQLMGNSDNVKSIPNYLNDLEKIYYKWLTEEIEISGLVTNIDKPLLEQTANCLYVMRKCDEHINKNGLLVEKYDRNGNMEEKPNPSIKIKLDYMTKYASLCNQLGMSPSARATLASKSLQAQEEENDVLKQILRDDGDF